MCLKVGTRSSRLAVWQTELVATGLRQAWPGLAIEHVLITTLGDRIPDVPLPRLGDKGIFTRELEDALRDGTIDLAVHSLKDLPTDLPRGLTIGAVLERADPRDALVAPHRSASTRFRPARAWARRRCGDGRNCSHDARISTCATCAATCPHVSTRS